jgi:hypothetical protein
MKQRDLFADQPSASETRGPHRFEPPPAEFVARIRSELQETLRLVREAARLPWPDLTQATLAELRFHSIARWLPEEEASALQSAFEAEMVRLYSVENEEAE